MTIRTIGNVPDDPSVEWSDIFCEAINQDIDGNGSYSRARGLHIHIADMKATEMRDVEIHITGVTRVNPEEKGEI